MVGVVVLPTLSGSLIIVMVAVVFVVMRVPWMVWCLMGIVLVSYYICDSGGSNSSNTGSCGIYVRYNDSSCGNSDCIIIVE